MKFIATNEDVGNIDFDCAQFLFDGIVNLEHYLCIQFNPEMIVHKNFTQLYYAIAKQLEQTSWFDFENEERDVRLFIACDYMTGILDFSDILIYAFRFQPSFERLVDFDNMFYNNDQYKIKVKLQPIEKLVMSSYFGRQLLGVS